MARSCSCEKETTMSKLAKKINELDNVVTAVSECQAGDDVTVKFKGRSTMYTVLKDVPFGHKIAVQPIPAGGKVIKYGEVIGLATADIATGEWVHTHNVRDDYKCLGKDGLPLPGQEEETPCC